jgi:hypothetical protein
MVALDYEAACEWFRAGLALSTKHADLPLG